MTAIQRFGSALNLNVHFHTLALQGVFVDDGCGGLRFVPNPEPTEAEVEVLLLATARRITRLVERHGIDLEQPQASRGESIRLRANRRCSRGSRVPRFSAGSRRAVAAGEMALRVGRKSDGTLRAALAERQAHFGGFDLHAGVSVPAGDRERLEHLCRYVLRPPVAQDALELRRMVRFFYGCGGPGTTARARSCSSRTS